MLNRASEPSLEAGIKSAVNSAEENLQISCAWYANALAVTRPAFGRGQRAATANGNAQDPAHFFQINCGAGRADPISGMLACDFFLPNMCWTPSAARCVAVVN